MRVGLVLTTSTGGVGRHVRDLAAALVADGVAVTVCGPDATEGLFRFSEVGARFAGVASVAGVRPDPALRAVVRLRRLLHDADVVHAHGLRAGVLAGLALGTPPPAYVVTWHNPVPGPAWALLARVAAARADVTLAVSADLAAAARRLGARDVRVAPVGAAPLPAPTRTVAAVRESLDLGDRPLVLAVGRLHRQKGFDVLVAAARAWSGRAATLVAGDGPARPDLERRIAELAVDVRLLGRRADVPDLLAAADVVVLPSRWEGSPLAAHEALQAGRPLVATAVGGLPDLVGHDAARLVPADDPAALAQAVVGLLDDPAAAAALGAAGRARVAAWPDAAAACRAVAAVYDELRSRR